MTTSKTPPVRDVCDFAPCLTVDLRGGTDLHHRWPKSWGGPADGPLVQLCPSHHRRQHSLLHAWANASAAGHDAPDPKVIALFDPDEVELAQYAHDKWAAAGRPKVLGEPAPTAGTHTHVHPAAEGIRPGDSP